MQWPLRCSKVAVGASNFAGMCGTLHCIYVSGAIFQHLQTHWPTFTWLCFSVIELCSNTATAGSALRLD